MTYRRKISAAFKRYFLTGILVIAPIAATLWILFWLIRFIMGTFEVGLFPEHYDLGPGTPKILQKAFNTILKTANFGIGAVLALTLVLVVGGLARNYLGRRMLRWWESVIERIPFLRSVYSALKQLMETLFLNSKKQFTKAVIIEWPRRGIYSIAFLTGETQPELENSIGAGGRLLNVFIPSTPNPTTGYFIMLEEKDVKPLNLTPEQAFKVIISGGIASPTEPHPNDEEDEQPK